MTEYKLQFPSTEQIAHDLALIYAREHFKEGPKSKYDALHELEKRYVFAYGHFHQTLSPQQLDLLYDHVSADGFEF